jgi:hypothetical protein
VFWKPQVNYLQFFDKGHWQKNCVYCKFAAQYETDCFNITVCFLPNGHIAGGSSPAGKKSNNPFCGGRRKKRIKRIE